MARVDEVAPDVFRISVYAERNDFTFNSFLLRDDVPILMHSNLRRFFPEVKDAVASLIDPATIRYVGFSHFEADECGALNDWLEVAPEAEPLCSFVGARTCIDDFGLRPARVLEADEAIDTGRHSIRMIETKHVPHGWDACVFFDEADRTLFCSDLFGHNGDTDAVFEGDVVGRSAHYNEKQQLGPMSGSVPFTPHTRPILEKLAALDPSTLACMHGSSYRGDGATALRDLGEVLQRSFGAPN